MKLSLAIYVLDRISIKRIESSRISLSAKLIVNANLDKENWKSIQRKNFMVGCITNLDKENWKEEKQEIVNEIAWGRISIKRIESLCKHSLSRLSIFESR